MVFLQEKVSQIFHEAMPLVAKHNAETNTLPDHVLKPSYERYCNLESKGMTRIYVMRDDLSDGRLVGYCSIFVCPHMHYETVWANQDLLFVEPEFRGFYARAFVRWTDERLKSEGVTCISRAVHVKKDYSKTLLKLGYGKLETSYLKVLG